MKVKQLVLVITLLAIGLVGLANAAENSAPASLGLTVSPPSIEVSGNPGGAIDETVRISNDSSQTLTLEVNAQDFKVDGTEGSVSVTASDQDPNAASKWFKFTSKQYDVKSKTTVAVPVHIDIPKSAEPGGHFVSVLFNPKAANGTTGQIGARVIQRVGSLFLMRISGAVVEDGLIQQVKTKSFVGAWDEVTASDGKTKILVARDEKLLEERPRKWFSQGPVAFDIIFKNTGNIHFKPAGTLAIYNIFGHKVADLPLDTRNVFPHGERRITVIWPQKSLWDFYYRAHVTAIYGTQNKLVSGEAKFIGFPLGALIAIIVILLLLVVLRRRLVQALRVLIRGK